MSQRPRRVVSLCPSITETLVEIGGLSVLAAATRFCTRPKGVLRGLPRIGGTKDPDVARILALEPDLVFANEEENRLEDVERLRDAGVEVDVTFPRRVGDVPGDVRQWGRGLQGDCVDRAETLASRIERDLAALELEPAPGVFPYAYWIWMDPWMTISDDTYVADLLRLAGGENVFGAEPERYPAASPADSLSRGAKVHFFPDEPFPFRARKHESLASKLFGPGTRRLFVSGDDYCWHGYRTLAGLAAVRDLRRQLAGSALKPV
jgi:ABC-type Fe3+-hydroxamate transport system substrate-binding protein